LLVPDGTRASCPVNEGYPGKVGVGHMCAVAEHGTNKGKLINKLDPKKVASLRVIH
jgi:hypothetical protein